MRLPVLFVVGLVVASCVRTQDVAGPAPGAGVSAAPGAASAPLDAATAALLDRAVAERMDLDLAAAGAEPESVLWDAFANRPYEKQFTAITTEDWYRKCEAFRARLLERAAAGGLDAASLARAVDTLGIRATDGVATVPVGAFAARAGEAAVWIVVAKWEEAGTITDAETGASRWHSLGHIWIRAVRASDGAVVASSRCK